MATRNDITVLWHLDPRLIFVAAPSVEVTIQDLHDTLRDLEDEPENMIYPSIISTAGKENLGGGVQVGLTATLQNARLGFDARKEWISDGYVTSADINGLTLIDSEATFISDGVVPGAWIVNIDDRAIASVRVVDSETRLTTDLLDSGFNNQFEVDDDYRIMRVIQMNVSGGNLVAVDGYGAELDPIIPTAGTQVVRTAASSATLQSQLQLEHATYNERITIDVTSAFSGTAFPIGSQIQPVNNVTDAIIIATARGFNRFFIIGDITFVTGDVISGFIIEGDSPVKSTITVDPGAIVTDVEFLNATLSGTLDGGSQIERCQLNDVSFIDGLIQRCALTGTITLSGATQASIFNSASGIPGSDTPIIDMGGSGSAMIMRNYSGGIKLINKTGPDPVSIDINSGQIIIDSTVTNGLIIIRGMGEPVEDNSTGTAIIDTTGYLSTVTISAAVWDGYIANHDAYGTFGRALSFQVSEEAEVSGGTAAIPQTTLRQADDYWNDHQVVIRDAVTNEIVVRNITDYSRTNGALTLNNPLPFTPQVNDHVLIFAKSAAASATVDNTAIAAAVWDKSMSDHDAYGSFGRALGFQVSEETFISGGTAAIPQTNLRQPDDFWNDHQVVIKDVTTNEIIVRNITDYAQTNGALTLNTALPFTPAVNDPVLIFAKSAAASATVDNAAIADAVWDESLAGHATLGTAGAITAATIYMHRVHVSSTGAAGTVIGVNGTPGNPVDSLADAETIATALGLTSFHIMSGSFILTSSFTEWLFTGQDEAEIDINGQNVNSSIFEDILVKGTNVGTISIKRGIIEDITDFKGLVSQSGISGTISLAAGESTFERCHSREPGTGTPTIDAVGAGRTINFRAYSGGLQVENMTDASNIMTAEFIAGQMIIDSSCTAGTIDVRGIIKPLQDNSAGTTVITSGVVNQQVISDAVWDEATADHTTTGTFGSTNQADAYQTADAIWTTQASGYFNNDGSMGQVLGFTLAASATVTASVDGYTIQTNLSQASNFWTGHQAVLYDVSTGIRVARNISTYTQSSGTVTFSSTLPFTPAAGDLLMIISRTSGGSATVDVAAVADAVWDEPLSEHVDPTTFGNLQFGATDGYELIPDAPTNTSVCVDRGKFSNAMVVGVGNGSIEYISKSKTYKAQTNKLTISVRKRTIGISVDNGANYLNLAIGVHSLSIGWIRRLKINGLGTWEVIASFN